MTEPVCLWTEVYIPDYRLYIESRIDHENNVLMQDAKQRAEYKEEYKAFSWWKRLWEPKPGECEHSEIVRYYTKKSIKEYNQTLARLNYEELICGRKYTRVPHDSPFFEWRKEQ